MPVAQYRLYCSNFELRPGIRPEIKKLGRIGYSILGHGYARIQVLFVDLYIVADIYILVHDEDTPLLLCTKDLISNGLQSLVLSQNISYKGRTQKLAL